jgi:hypothetical protein
MRTDTNSKPAFKITMTDEMKTKFEARLAQKLADGKITQEQYDAAIAKIENGECPMMGKRGDMHKGYDKMSASNIRTVKSMS